MITLGVLACFVAFALVFILVLGSRRFSLAITFLKIAWVPVAALLLQVILWKPMFANLSYFGAVPPLLTGIVSLFLATIGATLVAAGRSRNEDTGGLLRATLLAAIPGMILLGLMVYGLVTALLR